MEKRYDATLEDVWRIKREIASEHSSLEAYFKGMMDYQDDLRKQGVNLVYLPANRVAPQCRDSGSGVGS